MHPFLLVISLLATIVATQLAHAEARKQSGRDLYFQYCAVCHGQDGTGRHGRDVKAPAPADLTKIAARRGGVWPMLEVMSIIDGYTKRTTPRPGMPVFKEMLTGPEVDFDTGNGRTQRVPERLVAIARYLEALQSPTPQRYVP